MRGEVARGPGLVLAELTLEGPGSVWVVGMNQNVSLKTDFRAEHLGAVVTLILGRVVDIGLVISQPTLGHETLKKISLIKALKKFTF